MIATIFQTADSFQYYRMLQATSRTAIEYCRRHGHYYESFVGIKRGYHLYQATFNRIIQLREMIDRGWQGWAMYLDADAYIVDFGFDLTEYITFHGNRAGVFVPSGGSENQWDINAGVFLINLGHPMGRSLADRWYNRFMQVTDAQLAARVHWLEYDNDQHMLAHILRDNCEIQSEIHFESRDLMNSDTASFIRQHLRAYSHSLQSRIQAIEIAVERVLPAAADRADATAAARETVVGLYRAILLRQPDPVGLEHYMAHLLRVGIATGVGEIGRMMIDSEEFGQIQQRTGNHRPGL